MMTGIVSALLGILTACGQKKAMPEGALKSIEYTVSGTMAGYMYEAHVDKQPDGSVILKASYENYGPLVVKKVEASALDELRKIIEEEKMYAYKEHYSPHGEVLDGYSWSFRARFEGDEYIYSGGSNKEPPTNGLGRIRGLVIQLIGDTRPTGWLEEDKEYKWEGTCWTDGCGSFTIDADEHINWKNATDEDSTQSKAIDYRLFHQSSPVQDLCMVRKSDGNDLAYEHTDGSAAAISKLQQRDLRLLLAGTYKTANGRQYIFTRDGKFKSTPDGKAVPYEFTPAKKGYANIIKAGANKWQVCLTDSGMNLYQAPSTAKPGQHGPLLATLTMTDNGSDIPGRWAFFSQYVVSRYLLMLMPPRMRQRASDEIYARHGHPFWNNEEARKYYEQKPWYEKADNQEHLAPVEELNQMAIYRIRHLPAEPSYPWFEKDEQQPLPEK